MSTLRLRDLRPVPAPPAHEETDGLWICLENDEGRLLAGLHVQPQGGRCRPRLLFHLGRVVHAAPEFGLHQVQTTLQLSHDGSGEAEFSGLYLAPELQGSPEGDELLDRLLHEAWTQLLERNPESGGAQRVLVELPGWRDAQGRSPVWDGLVRPFLPAALADAESSLRERFGPALATHLGAMLPRQLIHASFLPPEAQQALGRCDSAYEFWRRALGRAGFSDWQHCRVDDGGPVLTRPLPDRQP